MPTTWSVVAPSTSDFRPDVCRHTSGCSLDGRERQIATSSGEGSLLCNRWDASMVWTTRTEASRSFSSSDSASYAA